MVQKLHVMAPPNVFTLASFQLILKSFPSLQELVVDLPEDQLREFAWGHKKDCITIGKVLDALSIPCCISDRKTRMFLSPTVDLIKRRAVTSEIEDVILYTKSLHRDLSTMFGLPRGGEIATRTDVCLLSKLSGTARDLEACLKKVYSLCIWREAADEEVFEEEVEAVPVIPKPTRLEGIVAETSEPVIVEDEDPVDEIDDVEPVHQVETDTDDVMEVEEVQEVQEDQVEEITYKDDDDHEEEPVVVEEKEDEEAEAETSTKGAHNAAEEIDDVEPAEVEESSPPVDPTKLLAAGVSITVIDKKKKGEMTSEDQPKTQTVPAAAAAPAAPSSSVASATKTVKGDLELSSDISVTVVQKHKPPSQTGKFTLR